MVDIVVFCLGMVGMVVFCLGMSGVWWIWWCFVWVCQRYGGYGGVLSGYVRGMVDMVVFCLGMSGVWWVWWYAGRGIIKSVNCKIMTSQNTHHVYRLSLYLVNQAKSRRRWPNINASLGECIVLYLHPASDVETPPAMLAQL